MVNEQSVDELLTLIKDIAHLNNIEYWAMPVGATAESQEHYSIELIEQLIGLGFHIADRTHIRLFANSIGK